MLQNVKMIWQADHLAGYMHHLQICFWCFFSATQILCRWSKDVFVLQIKELTIMMTWQADQLAYYMQTWQIICKSLFDLFLVCSSIFFADDAADDKLVCFLWNRSIADLLQIYLFCMDSYNIKLMGENPCFTHTTVPHKKRETVENFWSPNKQMRGSSFTVLFCFYW